MTDKEVNIEYNMVCQNLSKRRLKPAFDKLEQLIRASGQLIYLDEWRNLEQTYNYMLQYTVEGINDPERQKVYRKLIVSVFELADKVLDSELLKKSPKLEYERTRSFNKTEIDFSKHLDELEEFYLHNELVSLVNKTDVKTNSETADATSHQDSIVHLFYHFWFTNKLGKAEKEFLNSLFKSNLIITPYKSFLVTTLTLSLLRYFDESKFSLLFELYEHDNAEVNRRALIGLLIGLYKYDQRLSFYPNILGHLKILNEKQLFKRDLETAILQFIRSKETEKIQKKITDEIIPEMIKISPNLKDKINLDSLMGDTLGEDENPEWEKIFEDSPGLMNKMEEFSEMQMEGADVFMSSFSMLKMFPFFSEISNWFMPFFPNNPEIELVLDRDDEINTNFIKAIDDAPILCNSDKYSFCFSLQNLPADNREFMAEGMKAEMSQFNELQKDEEITDPGKKTSFISNQYIQDLYRFFKLHPRKNDFEDIFGWQFDFHNKTAFSEVLNDDDEILRKIAEYYFSKNYYEAAVEVFVILSERGNSGELYQKMGFCFQKMGNYEEALKQYKKAELYDLNRKWNLNKIALCYRNLKQPQKALEYYRMVEKLDEENLNVQLNIGHCLLELEEFDEALKCYFKVEYLAPGNKKVWRPIAWCSFVVGKTEQAERYFQKLIDEDPNKHDYMNMGHVQWSLGRRKDALDFYKKSITQTEFTETEFFEVIEEDLHHLLKQGVDKDDVPIMLDQLRYFVAE